MYDHHSTNTNNLKNIFMFSWIVNIHRYLKSLYKQCATYLKVFFLEHQLGVQIASILKNQTLVDVASSLCVVALRQHTDHQYYAFTITLLGYSFMSGFGFPPTWFWRANEQHVWETEWWPSSRPRDNSCMVSPMSRALVFLEWERYAHSAHAYKHSHTRTHTHRNRPLL